MVMVGGSCQARSRVGGGAGTLLGIIGGCDTCHHPYFRRDYYFFLGARERLEKKRNFKKAKRKYDNNLS